LFIKKIVIDCSWNKTNQAQTLNLKLCAFLKGVTTHFVFVFVVIFRMSDDDDDDGYDAFNDEPAPSGKNRVKECLNWITLQWLKSPIGLLKVAQFGTLLMGLIVIGAVTDAHRTSMEFFIFVVTAGWVFVLITIVLYILDVYSKLPQILTNNFTQFVACGK